MPIGRNGEKRPTNPIEAGIMVARIAVGDIDEDYVEKPKSMPNRSEGGKKGGRVRAVRLTAAQRHEIARKGGVARWRRDKDKSSS